MGGNPVTYLTFANFFTFIYGWIGLWCLIAFLEMITRRGKNWADYDVLTFRFAVAGVTLSVFTNRFWNPAAAPQEPLITPYLWAMVFFHLLLAYASAATAIRVGIRLWQDRKRRETPEQGVERRHREITDAITRAGRGRGRK